MFAEGCNETLKIFLRKNELQNKLLVIEHIEYELYYLAQY